ncbi:hypothetical protein C9I90_13960 [Photobacterium aphoticum]|uniref:Uncharacterized protein n=1 Tax=Photobacterium aphoticum TaxID=754436 RepID=A0A0J1JH37_9GAMM|nr:hypothetical protein ABT58_08570 [Photobacterium aphoticum]PSU56108.1 hypothetical protein C9I90_13960 [Photobacterium aphoticum]
MRPENRKQCFICKLLLMKVNKCVSARAEYYFRNGDDDILPSYIKMIGDIIYKKYASHWEAH